MARRVRSMIFWRRLMAPFRILIVKHLLLGVVRRTSLKLFSSLRVSTSTSPGLIRKMDKLWVSRTMSEREILRTYELMKSSRMFFIIITIRRYTILRCNKVLKSHNYRVYVKIHILVKPPFGVQQPRFKIAGLSLVILIRNGTTRI